jgi:amino acid permease
MVHFLEGVGLKDHFVTGEDFKKLDALLSCVCICYPLCLMKKIGALRYTSLLSMFMMFYTIFSVVVEFPFYFKTNAYDPKYTIHYAKIDLHIFEAFSITFLSYTCQPNLFPIYRELIDPVERRMKKVKLIILLFVGHK